MMQMIIEIDELTEFGNLPEEQQADVTAANIQWPEAIMLGTDAVNGKTLLMIACDVPRETIEGMIEAHELSWLVLAVENEPIVQGLLLPFYSDVPTFDESGEQTGTEAVTDLTGRIQTFAGHSWLYA